jgi:hypothetical protein
MTHNEWQQIIDTQLASNWPKYDWGFYEVDGVVTSEKLNNAYAMLRYYSASMVQVGITQYAQSHLDETWPRTLWQAVKQYCEKHTPNTVTPYDEYGLTRNERANVVRHNRERWPDQLQAWTDDDVYREWLRETRAPVLPERQGATG